MDNDPSQQVHQQSSVTTANATPPDVDDVGITEADDAPEEETAVTEQTSNEPAQLAQQQSSVTTANETPLNVADGGISKASDAPEEEMVVTEYKVWTRPWVE